MKSPLTSIHRIQRAALCAVLWIGFTFAPSSVLATLCVELQIAQKNSQQVANEFEKYLAGLRRGELVETERLQAKMEDLRTGIDAVTPDPNDAVALQQKSSLDIFHSLMGRLIDFKTRPDLIMDISQFRDSYVADWRNFLVESANLEAGSSFRRSLDGVQRSFSSIFDGLDPQTLQGYSVLYGEAAYTNNNTLFANKYVAAAADAKVLIAVQDLATSALSRAVVRIDDATFSSSLYENPGAQGPPYNPGEVAARIEAGEAGYQWGSVHRPLRGSPRITITNAEAYVTWLDSTHFENALDPYVKKQTRLAAESFSIPYEVDGVAGGGAIPLFNSVPGTHAEIFAFNEVFVHIRSRKPELFSTTGSSEFVDSATENSVLDSISISTFDFSARTAVARHGNAFRACVHCESIIPARVTVFSGAKEEPEFFPTTP